MFQCHEVRTSSLWHILWGLWIIRCLSRIYWCLVHSAFEELWHRRTGTRTVLDMSPGGTLFLSAHCLPEGQASGAVCVCVKPKISAIICQSEGAEVGFRNVFFSKRVRHSSGTVDGFKVNNISDREARRSRMCSVLWAARRKHWDLCVVLETGPQETTDNWTEGPGLWKSAVLAAAHASTCLYL